MKTALADAQTNLQKAQERMKRPVDKRRRSKTYKVGDEVVLTTVNLRSYCPHLSPKIKARWVGPFRVTREISLVAFGLDLPPGMMRWLWPLGRVWAPAIMPLHYLYWIWSCPWVFVF